MTLNSKKKNAEKKPKPISSKYLDNAALYYVSRYATSKANLKNILMRKIDKRVRLGAERPVEADQWVISIIDKFESLGLIDDDQYAASRAQNLLRKGKSTWLIQQDLHQKGVPSEVATAVIEGLGHKDIIELQAAARFVRRKRIGPFENSRMVSRKKRYTDKQLFEKNMMAMARAGFSPDVSKKILEAQSEAEIDEILTTLEK